MPPKTGMTFEEAHEQWLYEKLLEEGVICFHGWEIEKCQECQNTKIYDAQMGGF